MSGEKSRTCGKKVENGAGVQNNPTTKEIPQVESAGFLGRGFTQYEETREKEKEQTPGVGGGGEEGRRGGGWVKSREESVW